MPQQHQQHAAQTEITHQKDQPQGAHTAGRYPGGEAKDDLSQGRIDGRNMGMINPGQHKRQPGILLGEPDKGLEGCPGRVRRLPDAERGELVGIQALGNDRAIPQIAVEVVLLNRLREEQGYAKEQPKAHDQPDRPARCLLAGTTQQQTDSQAIADKYAGVDRHKEKNGTLKMPLPIDESVAQPGQYAIQYA